MDFFLTLTLDKDDLARLEACASLRGESPEQVAAQLIRQQLVAIARSGVRLDLDDVPAKVVM